MPNLNSADEQRSVIPAGTALDLVMRVRPGGEGEGGFLKRSKGGDSKALDAEFTVIGGQYDKRRIYGLFTVEGVTQGHAQAREISFQKLRAIVESARGIRPDDKSEAAVKARDVGWGDFNGMAFMAKVAVEPPRQNPQTGEWYSAKNTLGEVIAPDRQNWRQVDYVPGLDDGGNSVGNPAPTNGGGTTLIRPDWGN